MSVRGFLQSFQSQDSSTEMKLPRESGPMMVPRQLKTAQSRSKSAQHGPRTAKDRSKTAPDKGAQLLSFSLLSCLWFLLALSAGRSSLVTIIPATLRSQGILREYSSCMCNAGAICISPTVCNLFFPANHQYSVSSLETVQK